MPKITESRPTDLIFQSRACANSPFNVLAHGYDGDSHSFEPVQLGLGKELIVVHTGPVALSTVEMVRTERTLEISPEHKRALEKIQAELAADPYRWDGQKWRTEGITICNVYGEQKVFIAVSPILYSEHDLLRRQDFADRRHYPNPITVVGLVETVDGYLCLGVKDGQISDQTGIGTIGSGFIEREGNQQPSSVLWHAGHEIADEMTFFGPPGIIPPVAPELVFVRDPGVDPKDEKNWMKNPFDPAKAMLTGHAFGSNHDTANEYWQPTNAESHQVRLRFHYRNNSEWRSEHQLGVLVPNSSEMLEKILVEGKLRIPSHLFSKFTGDGDFAEAQLSDHALASLYFYKRHRDAGLIVPSTVRGDCDCRYVTREMSIGQV